MIVGPSSTLFSVEFDYFGHQSHSMTNHLIVGMTVIHRGNFQRKVENIAQTLRIL